VILVKTEWCEESLKRGMRMKEEEKVVKKFANYLDDPLFLWSGQRHSDWLKK